MLDTLTVMRYLMWTRPKSRSVESESKVTLGLTVYKESNHHSKIMDGITEAMKLLGWSWDMLTGDLLFSLFLKGFWGTFISKLEHKILVNGGSLTLMHRPIIDPIQLSSVSCDDYLSMHTPNQFMSLFLISHNMIKKEHLGRALSRNTKINQDASLGSALICNSATSKETEKLPHLSLCFHRKAMKITWTSGPLASTSPMLGFQIYTATCSCHVTILFSFLIIFY